MIDTRFVVIHGNVSLIPAIVIKLKPESVLPQSILSAAGYYNPMTDETNPSILLLNIDPHSCQAIYATSPEHDIDMDDALTWVQSHYDELAKDDVTLIDLPFIRGEADAPTTSLTREFIMPWLLSGTSD